MGLPLHVSLFLWNRGGLVNDLRDNCFTQGQASWPKKLKTLKNSSKFFFSLLNFLFYFISGKESFFQKISMRPWQIPLSKCWLYHTNLLKKDSSRVLLQKMVRHPTCMILSNQLGHTEDGWRDALCTPVLLGLSATGAPAETPESRPPRPPPETSLSPPSKDSDCFDRHHAFLASHFEV